MPIHFRESSRLRLCLLFSAAMLASCSGDPPAAPPPVAAPAPAPAPAPVVAPAITTAPASITVSAGAAVSLGVVATGTGPLSYQWERDGVALAGATGATLGFSAAESDSGAEFRVVVSNSAGSVTSTAAVLTVLPVVEPPLITVAPQSVSALDGGSATFSVVATGTAPFTYVWQRNGSPIADATEAEYTTPGLTLADNGAQYRVVVSNSAGTQTSATATLSVNPVAPAITAGPAGVSVTAGQTASFSAEATGSAPLGYQWQRNGVAITGATAASYTTPATTVADNGARFRVVVSNAAGSVTSTEATLGVTAAVVAPAFSTAPTGATVEEGQTATFTAAATGTAPLAYQWLRNGSAIAGATAASHTTPATTVAADNGARFSVRVSNAAGSVTSGEVVLTVNAASSPLIGRGWAAGQLLEVDDNPVFSRVEGIADDGRATIVFVKSDGSRRVLYATHGSPNGPGAAPTWTTPLAVDLDDGGARGMPTTTSNQYGLAVAANGNAVVWWRTVANCTASTYRTNFTCNYLQVRRYLAASGTWRDIEQVADFPSGDIEAQVNDRGDIAMALPGYVRTGTGATAYSVRRAVLWRGAAEGEWRKHTFDHAALASDHIRLSEGGQVLYAATAAQDGTVDAVAARGTVEGGMQPLQVLDQRGNSVTLRHVAAGRQGQQIVLWTQNNGTATTLHAATAASPAEDFAVADLGRGHDATKSFLALADDGRALLLELGARRRTTFSAGQWAEPVPLPAAVSTSSFPSCSFVRTGDFLCVQTSSSGGLGAQHGIWMSYDAARNVVVQSYTNTSPGAGFVLGLNTTNRATGMGEPLLSVSGHAVITLRNEYDVLPTPAAPSGDRRNVDNLWATFFK